MKKIKHWTVSFQNGESLITQGENIAIITENIKEFGFPVYAVTSIVFLKEE